MFGKSYHLFASGTGNSKRQNLAFWNKYHAIASLHITMMISSLDSSHSRENQPRKLPDINTSPNNIGGVLAEYPSDDPKSVLVVVLTIYQTWYIRTREQSQDDNLDVKSDNETNTPEDVFIPFTEDSHTCRSP
ncbi:hypothetical protein H100_06418 [Trichophyton rubrum MR850]|nr:hypothetical protein H100_06418 [Trichophyton rubrum MR850]